MVKRKLVVIAWGAVAAVAVSACSDPPTSAVPKEKRVHPELVTSAIPSPQDNRPPPPQPRDARAERDRAMEEAERVAEAVRRDREKPFYENVPAETEYEYQNEGQADAAFQNIMRSANEPFRAPDPSSDDEHPSNQPSERGSRTWGAGQQRVLLTCQPKVVLKKGTAPSAGVVVRLPIGTTLMVMPPEDTGEGSDADAAIEAPVVKAGKTPPKVWTHVEAPEGRRGWIDEALTREVSSRDPSEAYLTCCAAIRDAESASASARERFATRVEYINCLGRGVQAMGAKNPASVAREQSVAIAHAAELVDKTQLGAEPYKSFVARYGGALAWTPEGYVLKASELWTLEEKYHGTEAGEAFAWQAAHDGAMDRSCNREVVCNVQQARARWGEYLARYPGGPHAREAIDTIIAMRPRDENDPNLPLDRNAESVAACLKTLAELSAIVDNTRAVGRVQASGALEALRRFVLARSGHIEGRR